MFSDKNNNQAKKFKIEKEDFEMFDLSREVENIDKKIENGNKFKDFFDYLDNFALEMNKLLINKTDFVLYMNSPFKHKQGIEILNLYFKDTEYYLLYTDLKNHKNRAELKSILNVFKENYDKIKENYVFIVLDNEMVYKYLFNFRTGKVYYIKHLKRKHLI